MTPLKAPKKLRKMVAEARRREIEKIAKFRELCKKGVRVTTYRADK